MFKSILFTVFSFVCLFASVSDARPRSSTSHSAAVSSVMAEMGSTIESMKKIHSAFLTMADGTTTCAAISAEASTNITNDCGALFAAPIDLEQLIRGKVATACDGALKSEAVVKCTATFLASYKAAFTVCGAANASDVSAAIITKVGGNAKIFANLTALATLGKAICVKSDDNANAYCLDTIIDGNIKTAFSELKVNNAFATAVCKPCARQLIASLGGIPQFQELVDGLTFMCTQDPSNSTNYCMDSVSLLVSFIGKDFKTEFAKANEAQIKQLCSPCTTSVINAFELVKPFIPATIDVSKLKEYIPAIKNACVRDPSGDYCPLYLKDPVKGLAKWADGLLTNAAATASLSSCLPLTAPGTECPASCANGITNILASYGCCLGIMEIKDLSGFLPADSIAGNVFNAAIVKCTFSLPTRCAGSTTVTLPAFFVLDNIRFAWANTNAKFQPAFIKDIAAAFSLDSAAVVIKSLSSNAEGGVTVSLELSVDSSVAAGYSATIKSRIASTLSFGQTNAAASEPSSASDTNNGKIDQTKGVNAAPSSDVGTTSGAAAVKASIATIALIISSFIAIKLY